MKNALIKITTADRCGNYVDECGFCHLYMVGAVDPGKRTFLLEVNSGEYQRGARCLCLVKTYKTKAPEITSLFGYDIPRELLADICAEAVSLYK